MGKQLVLGLLGLVLGSTLAACSGAEGQDDEQIAQTQEGLGLYNGGYFQESGSPRVFKVDAGRFCWVYDPGELGALRHQSVGTWDGYTRPTFAGIQASGRVYQGSCGYPTGMFRRDGSPPVYLVNSTSYCHVKDDRQLNIKGGSGAVLVLKVKPGEMDLGETYAEGPDQGWLGHPRLNNAGDCTF